MACLGRYHTIKELNHGSYGSVALARDTLLDRVVAIKAMATYGAAGTMARNEVELHGSLHHPNIVEIYDHVEIDDRMYLILEYCPRGDVYEAITSARAPCSHENVRDCMLQLVDAVLYMHSKGIAHRDIKPENILLGATGEFKLADLGLATGDEWTCEVGVGSDRYMPPEQFDESGTLHSSHKADYWAVGITLLNILFGRNPFKKATEEDKLWSDYMRNRESLYDIFPTMSEDTFEALQHVLQPRPEQRDLHAFRRAVLNVAEWTTEGIVEDDFAAADAPVAITENRRPLRTPSLQHPDPADASGKTTPVPTSFPWKSALSVQPLEAAASRRSSSKRLETIRDDEISESFDSGIGTSLRGLPPYHLMDTSTSDAVQSLPTNIVMHTTASTATRKRDKSHLHFAKSWSDWVEDEEEERERENGVEEASTSSGEVDTGGDEDWMPHWEE